MTVYGAAVLDVVASKSSANRAELQARLNEAIGRFNERFQAILSVPAGITVGDEWEFLTVRPSHAYELVQWFQEALRPQGVELYAGLGIGGLRTPPAADIRQMDGPCFHLARRAVEIAKESGGSRHKRIFSKRNRVYLLRGGVRRGRCRNPRSRGPWKPRRHTRMRSWRPSCHCRRSPTP